MRSINIIILIIMKNKNVYPWIVVALLWVVALLNYMDRQMLSTMQEAMKVDIVELNKAEAFGALMAVFLWIYGFMSPIAGMIADRVNRKWLVVGSLFVWSGVTYLMGYADNFHELYWLRAVMGVSEALYIPSALSLIADWHQGKSRSLAIGVHMTGLYVGQAIGGFGATVAAIFSWHTTFHWFGIVGMIYSVVLIFLLRENPDRMIAEQPSSAAGKEKRPSLFGGLSMLFSTWAFWIILFYFAAPSLPGWATKNWLPTLFSESLGIPMAGSRAYIYHNNCLLFFRGRDSWRNPVRPLGAEKYSRACLYGSHWVGAHSSGIDAAGIWKQLRGCHWSRVVVRNRFWDIRC